MRMVLVFMGMSMTVAMLVTVVPQLSFVQQKKEDESCQQHRKRRVGANVGLEHFWHQVQKRRAQQRPRSQAEHVVGEPSQRPK